MARYIDADAFLEKMRSTGRYFSVKFDIEQMPTADVAPKRETIEKFLEDAKQKGYCLVHVEGLTEDLAIKIEMAKIETAREIFAEIEGILVRPESPTALFCLCSKHSYAELKKKYIGEDTNVPAESEDATDTKDSRKKTNFDRIKEMTVEEMAKFIPDWSYTGACKCGEKSYVDCNNECENCVKDWLESEVNENG